MTALHKLYSVYQVDSTSPAWEQGSQPRAGLNRGEKGPLL